MMYPSPFQKAVALVPRVFPRTECFLNGSIMCSTGKLEDARSRAMLAVMWTGLARFNCVADLRLCDILLAQADDFGAPESEP